MIDSLDMLREEIEKENYVGALGFEAKQFGLVTLHRPANVDDRQSLSGILEALICIQRYSAHFSGSPGTLNRLTEFGIKEILDRAENILMTKPLSYIRFMNLLFNSRIVITDSGGVQEETTYLGIPCLTLRPNTERPITVTQGTNQLCSLGNLKAKADAVLAGRSADLAKPLLWDGKTADRLVDSVRQLL